MKSGNQEIVGEKCIKNKDGNIVYDDMSKLDVWKQHYEGLLNSEFEWDENGHTHKFYPKFGFQNRTLTVQ